MNDISTAYDVIIIGSGASGLMTAITAARRGRSVLVLEKANKVGKKILMSGGGRCNFTNYFVEPKNFISGNPHFCKSALNRYTQWDFIALVEEHGIAYEERKHGQLFCVISAKDILKMLLDECERYGVVVETDCEVTSIATLTQPSHAGQSPVGGSLHRYQVSVSQRHRSHLLVCESLVVASGALSIPTLGGSGIGYDIAKQFGLGVTELRAGLVPFMFSDVMKSICERLSGLSLEVTIECNHQQFTEDLLFTHRGISGPVVLQISNYWGPGDEVTINLLPSVTVARWLINTKQKQGSQLLRTALNQHLPKSLISELQGLWWPETQDQPLAEFSDKQLAIIGDNINHWVLKPSTTEGYRTAEVTLGGVDTGAISSKTMEAKQQPGLYFIGEVLDVTGHLGGFNFQWAWSSAYCAGLFV